MALRVRTSGNSSNQAWRSGLPELRSGRAIVRELAKTDARRLLEIATHEQVTKFSWPAPDGVAAVEGFIEWTRGERMAGRYLCYAICASDGTLAGMFELRRLQPDFFRAEAGFFIAPDFWGTGIFGEAARLIVDFAFGAVGIHRIEARVAVDNDRSNAALRKLGAIQEGLLHEAFVRDGHYVDQMMWALLRRRSPLQHADV
jgi:ribosomal-protein-alanine N-acetyltransferase